jgi:hypothetical protein
MRLPDETRDHIGRRLVVPEDASIACRVIETLLTHIRAVPRKVPPMTYEVEPVAETDVEYTLRLIGGIEFVLLDYLRVIMSVSARIISVAIVAATNSINVTVARSEEHARVLAYVPPTHAKPRRVDIDYEDAKVPDKRDRATIEALVAAMYSPPRVPASMLFWFEQIYGVCDDDASMSRPRGEDADESEGTVVGYSLCFTKPPPLTLAFLDHLTVRYAGSLVASYLWSAPPAHVASVPVFVLNIRLASATSDGAARTLKSRAPAGLRTKRARHV